MSCDEHSGFLFAHACDRLAAWQCATCGKNICAEHTRMTESGYTCIGCTRLQVQQQTEASAAGVADPTDDPYFYDDDDYTTSAYYDADDYKAFDSSSSEPPDDGPEQDIGGS